MKFFAKFLGLFIVGTSLAFANATNKPLLHIKGKETANPTEKMGDKPRIKPKGTLPVAPDDKKQIIENPTEHAKSNGAAKK